MVNVEPTIEIIDEMAGKLNFYAKDLKRIAGKMRERQDLTYAVEALCVVTNAMNNLRLDLLIARPLREYQREAQEAK